MSLCKGEVDTQIADRGERETREEGEGEACKLQTTNCSTDERDKRGRGGPAVLTTNSKTALDT